jgi:hypothetical protein
MDKVQKYNLFNRVRGWTFVKTVMIFRVPLEVGFF